MSREPNSIVDILVQLHGEYVDKSGSTGGSPREFAQWIAANHPNLKQIWGDEAWTQFIRSTVWRRAGRELWEDDDGDGIKRQFTLLGHAMPRYLTIRDPEEKNGYRRVSSEHAIVSHLRQDWEILQEKADQAQEQANIRHEQYQLALQRASGNEKAFINGLVDNGDA